MIIANRIERIEFVGIAVIAAGVLFIPFQGVGSFYIRSITATGLCDLCWILVSPFLAFQLFLGWQKLRQSYLFGAILAMAASQILACFLAPSPLAEWRSIARQLMFILLTGGLGILLTKARYRIRIIRWFIGGGLAAALISLVGYIVVLLTGDVVEGANSFIFVSKNPLFSYWPRLAGTFGISPQHLGEYQLVLLTVMLYYFGSDGISLAKWKKLVSITIAITLLLLTFSYAWIGGVVLGAGILVFFHGRTHWVKWVSICGIALAVLFATWLMNVGWPTTLTDEDSRNGVPCERIDQYHQVIYFVNESKQRCHTKMIHWPYHHLMTSYLYSKIVTLRVIEENWIFGTGTSHYKQKAQQTIQDDFGTAIVVAYTSPHSLFLGSIATAGILGGASLLLFLAAIWKSKPKIHPKAWMATTPWLAIVGFILIGINIDVMANRSFWVLLGLVISQDIEGT